MSVKLIDLAEAENDLREIIQYHIRAAGVQSARNVYLTMRGEICRLKDFPHSGQIHPDPELAALGYRKLVLTRTYVAVYKVMEDGVYIYRIINGRTDYPKLLK